MMMFHKGAPRKDISTFMSPITLLHNPPNSMNTVLFKMAGSVFSCKVASCLLFESYTDTRPLLILLQLHLLWQIIFVYYTGTFSEGLE